SGAEPGHSGRVLVTSNPWPRRSTSASTDHAIPSTRSAHGTGGEPGTGVPAAPTGTPGELPARVGARRRGRAALPGRDGGPGRGPQRGAGPRLRDALPAGDGLVAGRAPDGPADPTGVALRRLR